MTATPRYVPILKGKRGEFDALGNLTEPTRASVYPLIEVLPSPEEQDVGADIDKAIAALRTRWFQEPFMLDLSSFDLDERYEGRTILGYAMGVARGFLRPVAVVRLGDSDAVYADAGQAGANGIGVAIRLISEDLDVEPEELNEELDRVLAIMELDPAEIDLIVDVGAISGDFAITGGARLIKGVLRDLSHFPDYRSVTVAAGAFPADLSNVAAWTLGEHPRDDAALYNRVRNRPMSRTINFGDYAIAHPLLAAGVPFAPPPQLRYTVSDRWLSLKGKRNDPRGNSQFYDVCATIASHPAFVGAELGEADRRIANGRGGGHGPGNATTWRTIGTQHHVDLVVSRLTILGEP